MALKDTTKKTSELDMNQAIKSAFNDVDKSLTTSGFLDAKVGHRITTTAVTTAIDDVRYFDMVASSSASVSLGSAIITVPTTGNLQVDQYVFASELPANTRIISIDSSTQITVSANATASNVAASLRIGNLLKRLRLTYNAPTKDFVIDSERFE